MAYVWRKRHLPSGHPFLVVVFTMWLWTMAVVAIYLAPTAETALLIGRLRFAIVAISPLVTFRFALSYSGRERWLTRPVELMLWVMPTITSLILLFQHELFVLETDLTKVGPFWWESGWVYGSWFPIHSTYSYTLTAFSIGLLGYTAFRSVFPYRFQAAVIFAGLLIPLFANIAGTYQLTPLRNLTIIGFTFTVAIWSWALFQHKFLDLMPVARDVIFDGLDDAIFVLDTQNRLIDINPAGRRLLNQPYEQLIGREVQQIFQNQAELWQKYAQVHEGRDEIFLNQPQGEQVFDLRISPLYQEKTHFIGRLLVLRDITAQKQLIKELDAYAHTVAHDLKNPIGALLGYGEMLEEELQLLANSEEAQDLLNRMSQTGRKMESIIGELLLMANMRRTEQVERQLLDMAQVVESALTRLQPIIETSQAEIILPPHWPAAYGYSAWVEEIWGNYLSNALKYGGEPPRVELGADEVGEMVRFWVKDNGRGISPEQQAKLFIEFSRLPQHQQLYGHGLGLSIVARIAHKLGGLVGVDSKVGQGSLFYFTLPKTMN